MTPFQDATPKPPKYAADLEAPMILPKQRASPASSLSSLPYRRSNPSLQKLFESTSSLSGSRPSSGSATPTGSVAPSSTLSPISRQNGTGTPKSLPPGVSDEYRVLIQQAFVPHVSVLADEETEAMIRSKGVEGGLLQLIRPFGEMVSGKITIRDSIGASRSHSDFGVRFIDPHHLLGLGRAPRHGPPLRVTTENGQEGTPRGSSASIRATSLGGDVSLVEALVDRHLQYAEFNFGGFPTHDATPHADTSSSPFYTLYLRRLLSGLPMVPHESFAHPTAGIIAVNSKHPNPIEAFRQLYTKQQEGEMRLPQWVDNDYLRYYVLVHEEETADITKSNRIFDDMKRHFGLNCHMLRLKTQECIPSDDDAVRLPTCEWMSASEELAEIQQREAADDLTDPTPYIPDSDLTAIRTFVREFVQQALVPQMERNVVTWNDQVLARRRGLSGRFMSLSKRWTPFGGSSSRTSSSSSIVGSSSSNYDPQGGFYRPDSPEALMRKLADQCFMLRDWKLALSTYDILRTDFSNDKAWRHYAGAAEMAALSALLLSGPGPGSSSTSKTRIENIDAWIEAASYSYMDRQRSAAPYFALRTLALSLELLRLRGSAAADDAARWAARILEAGLVGSVGMALFSERVSACYAARIGVGAFRIGSRRRKAAFWSVMAAESWLGLGKALQAEKCVEGALRLYGTKSEVENSASDASVSVISHTLPFPEMQRFIDGLRQQLLSLRLDMQGLGQEGEAQGEGKLIDVEESLVVEETETLMDKSPRSHRRSLIGGVGGGMPAPIDVGPRSPALERGAEKREDDMFE